MFVCSLRTFFLRGGHYTIEIIAKPPKTSHAKFAKYAKFRFKDDFANLADLA
jgi:hypothetical protein